MWISRAFPVVRGCYYELNREGIAAMILNRDPSMAKELFRSAAHNAPTQSAYAVALWNMRIAAKTERSDIRIDRVARMGIGLDRLAVING